jgi:FkbH-like protein
MMELNYTEILKHNKELAEGMKSEHQNITLFSNIIIHQVKEILEYTLRTEKINLKVYFGNYDNIIQDSEAYNSTNPVILFWELCNIIEGLQYRIELLNNKEFSDLVEKICSEIQLVFNNLKKTSLILVNKFSSLSYSSASFDRNQFDNLASQVNQYLETHLPSNAIVVDINKIISQVGVNESFDYRYFNSSKSLYSISFFKRYSQFIKPILLSIYGKAKKAIVFDCDNTLWKGILGEDGFNSIEMSPTTKSGAIFADIQATALSLNRQGVIICLCSKNNIADVEEVLQSHPDMQLRNENITINKSNWVDKATNIKNIADELNIGLDSIVFIDDSEFEINLVQEQLPEVTVLRVPSRIYEYPNMLRQNMGLFFNHSSTAEDRKKIDMYKQRLMGENDKKNYSNLEDYLSSLKLELTIYENNQDIIPRIAQLSQKTNQFNLTTKRYTESDIANIYESNQDTVFAFAVRDKYGDNGVTGVCIVQINDQEHTAEIDSLMMSCRIIGRNIEFSFIDQLISKLEVFKVRTVYANYIKTKKNEQVKDFYQKCSFIAVESSDVMVRYSLDIGNFNPKQLNYIGVKYEY